MRFRKQKTLSDRFGYYEEYIRRLARVPFAVEPRVQELGLPRGAVQMAYKEMRQFMFSGNVATYMIWVGGMFRLEQWSDYFEEQDDGAAFLRGLRALVKAKTPEGIILIRSSNLIRVTDLFLLSALPENVINLVMTVNRLANVHKLLVDAQSGIQMQTSAMKKLKELSLEETTRIIVEYQSHTPGDGASYISNPSKLLTPTTRETPSHTVIRSPDNEDVLSFPKHQSDQDKKAAKRSGAASRRSPYHRPSKHPQA